MFDFMIRSPIKIFLIIFLGCPPKCLECPDGPCTRYCSISNWCGEYKTHGIDGGTDCTRCAGNVLKQHEL